MVPVRRSVAAARQVHLQRLRRDGSGDLDPGAAPAAVGHRRPRRIAPWTGKVIAPNNLVLFDVIAIGPWTMTLTL